MKRTVTWDDSEEDVIVVHLGRVVSVELFEQIVKSIMNLLDKRYPVDKVWHLDS